MHYILFGRVNIDFWPSTLELSQNGLVSVLHSVILLSVICPLGPVSLWFLGRMAAHGSVSHEKPDHPSPLFWAYLLHLLLKYESIISYI